jgi:hypothetical protein
MLENQCRTWPDPIVAVVYVPLLRNPSGGLPSIPTYHNTTLEDVTRGISSFHAFMEATAQCALRVELVGQYLSRRSPRPYPINSLRNRALSAARTDLVLLLDVDFAASPMLGLPEPGYRDAAVYNQMVELTAKRRAIVLPAFEITNRKQDLTMAQNFARNMVMGERRSSRRPRCPQPAHHLFPRIAPPCARPVEPRARHTLMLCTLMLCLHADALLPPPPTPSCFLPLQPARRRCGAGTARARWTRSTGATRPGGTAPPTPPSGPASRGPSSTACSTSPSTSPSSCSPATRPPGSTSALWATAATRSPT